MTRRDYKLIASALAAVRPLGFANKREAQFFEHIITVMGNYLARDNANFNAATFHAACLAQEDE